MNKKMLNLAEVCWKTQTLGPGYRAVIWVQGCPFRCKGCISPDWIPIRQGWQIAPDKLATLILKDSAISGVTISGGEPILQASALVEFITNFRAIRSVDVILFTGYYYENLKDFPKLSPIAKLLDLVDVLIDGPYDEAKNDNKGIRGSSNQRIIHLSDRLIHYDLQNHPRQTEIQISDGKILFVGVPPKGVIPGVLDSIPDQLLIPEMSDTCERT